MRPTPAGDRVWTLQSLDGRPFAATATMQFPGRGRIAGRAPCNAYGAAMDAPYPWFELDRLAVTRRGCPDLPEERRYFAALGSMSQAEVSGDVLILRSEAGGEMVFRATGPAGR